MKDDALEKLAEAEHVQWCEWADALSHELSSLLEIIERQECDLSDEEHLLFFLKVKDRLDRWIGLWFRIPICLKMKRKMTESMPERYWILSMTDFSGILPAI